MLLEGLVAVVALIAAPALPRGMSYDINIDLARRPQFTQALKALGVDHDAPPPAVAAGGGVPVVVAVEDGLTRVERQVGESLHGRTGGAVTLAVGMARIFAEALPTSDRLVAYWYHFAILFEALFILTTIDTGTRIGRFLLRSS